MAYIGKSPALGNFVKLDAISVVNGQAAYTMQNGSVNFTDYSTVNQFLVSLNGTIQSAGSSFTVSSSTITFSSNLSTGDVIDFIIVFGNSLSAGTVSDSAITTAKLASTSVTAAKLNNDIISGTTALTSEPADTDEFLVSDAGTLKRIDYSLIKGGGITEADMFRLTANSSGDIDPISSNLERVDDATFAKIGTGVSLSSGTFSFASTGLYLIILNATFFFNGSADSNVNAVIKGTSNDSSYDVLGSAECGGDTSNNKKKEATTQTFFNCTNTSTHKIRFSTQSMGSNSLLGNTDQNNTIFTFIRLGDSQ